MTEYTATFDISEFENYGVTSPYLSTDQSSQVALVEERVNAQLDWLAQILGWNGTYYWDSLVSTVAQKRRLQTGSFGVYNGYILPRLVEVRNWENSIVIERDDRILSGLTFYLGDYEYKPTNLTTEGNNYVVTFENLPEQFYSDIAANAQLKVISPSAQPRPFHRPAPDTSGDASFACKLQGTSITLYPSWDTGKTLPYLLNTFITGSRYFFDLPVQLLISASLTVEPQYDFKSQSWYLQIPENSASNEVGLTATLSYSSYTLQVSLVPWFDPSDWNTKNTIDNFKGVWNNKGGKLPFHFTFDALEIHGFDEEKSIRLGEVVRSIPFDELLNSIYYQTADVSPDRPPSSGMGQVWWNSQTGAFSVYWGDPHNCGPWVEINYPEPPVNSDNIDYVFPDVASFLAYPDEIPEGCLVEITDISGLGPSSSIEGLYSNLVGPGVIQIYRKGGSPYWTALKITYYNEADFAANASNTPSRVNVGLLNSSGLAPSTANYTVANLQFAITEQLPLSIMKDTEAGLWYIAPTSSLKYIGNTRLFESSLDYNHPVDGEMNWEFLNSNPLQRAARVFYYNRWVQDPLSLEWNLEGDWVDVNETSSIAAVPQVVDFGAVLLYCDNKLLIEGETCSTENFQFVYNVDPLTGQFNFTYTPLNYFGTVNFPKITVSDSLTSAFVYDISSLVFSGLSYYMSPNVLDSETLLRLWKSENLSVVEDLSELELLRNPNPLVADENLGPSDDHWERYFVRLPPSYDRNGSVWQKVNLICQDLGYWGSSILPEQMDCPPELQEPVVYEQAYLYNEEPNSATYIYSEPYLFSDIVYGVGASGEYEDSAILPSFDSPYDDFSEAEIISYSPLHNRQADVTSRVGRGYGEWEGAYFRATPCSYLSGHLVNDLLNDTLEPMAPPIWDASVYKMPPTCVSNRDSSTVDANNYKVGYAFFAADLSAAEDAFFDLGVLSNG